MTAGCDSFRVFACSLKILIQIFDDVMLPFFVYGCDMSALPLREGQVESVWELMRIIEPQNNGETNMVNIFLIYCSLPVL